MKKLESLAQNFLHSFYLHAWPDKNLIPTIEKLTIDEAYAVQNIVNTVRTNKNERIAGYKVGCTSPAIQSQFGIKEPIYAPIFHPHIHQQRDLNLSINHYNKLAIEPEMVIVIKKDISGYKLTDHQIIDSIDYVNIGIELHNYHFWSQPPCLQELICSGGIHSGLIVGSHKIEPNRLDFKSEVFSVFSDGQLVLNADASQIMGGPLLSLRWLIEKLTKNNSGLKQGEIVIPGCPTALFPIDKEMQLKVKIDNIGEVEAMFVV